MKQSLLQYQLDLLQEECAEVIQIVSKIKRFGLMDVWPNQDKNPDKLNNLQRLHSELNDVFTVISLIQDTVDTELLGSDWTLMNAKIKRIEKYMAYSIEKGLLDI